MVIDLIRRLARALDAAGIGYQIIGGQAALRYGRPRFTEDIDVTVLVGPDEVDRLLRLCGDVGLSPGIDDPHGFVNQTHVLPCFEPATRLKVDFILGDSEYERQAAQRAEKVSIDDVCVAFASREDVVIQKAIAGRPIDWQDIEAILAKSPDIDAQYIRHWLEQFEPWIEQPLIRQFDERWNDGRCA